MRQILLPTDFSANASNAFFYILRLFRHEGCRFILLHSYKIDGYQSNSQLSPIPSEETLKKEQEKANTQLETLKEELANRDQHPENRYTCMAVNTSLTDAIQEQIEQHGIDLVVIGTQGHTGSYEVVYGINTINILEEVQNCPILAVPNDVDFKPIEEIVLVYGYKIELTAKDLEFIKELALSQKAAIRILHMLEGGGMSDLQNKNKKRLTDRLKDIPHSFHDLEHLSVPLGVYAFTESRGSEIISFINKKHSFIENLLFTPLYRNLGHYSRVPVLVLHQPEKV